MGCTRCGSYNYDHIAYENVGGYRFKVFKCNKCGKTFSEYDLL